MKTNNPELYTDQNSTHIYNFKIDEEWNKLLIHYKNIINTKSTWDINAWFGSSMGSGLEKNKIPVSTKQKQLT